MDFSTLGNYYDFTTTGLSAGFILANLVYALVLSLGIVFVYRTTRRGLSYAQSFVLTIVLMTLLGAMIMMVIQNNIVGAITLIGAFALIRFRTIVKETIDLGYVFFSLVTGVAVGVGHYVVALISVLFIGAVMLLLERWGFGSTTGAFEYLLLVRSNDPDFNAEPLKGVFEAHANRAELIASKSGASIGRDLSYTVSLKSRGAEEALLKAAQNISGVARVELLTGRHTSEY